VTIVGGPMGHLEAYDACTYLSQGRYHRFTLILEGASREDIIGLFLMVQGTMSFVIVQTSSGYTPLEYIPGWRVFLPLATLLSFPREGTLDGYAGTVAPIPCVS